MTSSCGTGGILLTFIMSVPPVDGRPSAHFFLVQRLDPDQNLFE